MEASVSVEMEERNGLLEDPSTNSTTALNTSQHNTNSNSHSILSSSSNAEPHLTLQDHLPPLTWSTATDVAFLIDSGPSGLRPNHQRILESVTCAAECPDDTTWSSLVLLGIIANRPEVLKMALHWTDPHPVAGFKRFRQMKCAVCVAAVRWCNDVDILALLLDDPRTPANRGFPIREAILRGRKDMVSILLQCPRVDPNRGTPLTLAVETNQIEIFRMLLDHPKLRINRCTFGIGSTALCQAIADQRFDMIDALMRFPGTNLNKGYLLSPLQLAVGVGNVRIVEMLLSFPDVVPDATTFKGESQHPLVIAIQNDDLRIFKALLKCDRVMLNEDVFDSMEDRGLIEFQQAVVDCHRPLILGKLWRVRITLMTVGLLFSILLCVAELSLVYFYLDIAVQLTFGLLTLAIPLVIAPTLQYAHGRYYQTHHLLLPPTAGPTTLANAAIVLVSLLAHVTIFPFYAMVLYHKAIGALFEEPDAYLRERCYVIFQHTMRLLTYYHALPQLVLQIVIALLRVQNPGGGEIISAIGKVPYEAQSVPYNYVLAVGTSFVCILYTIVCWLGKW